MDANPIPTPLGEISGLGRDLVAQDLQGVIAAVEALTGHDVELDLSDVEPVDERLSFLVQRPAEWLLQHIVNRASADADGAPQDALPTVCEAKQLPILVIDEAQHLRNDVLEDLRLLCNSPW